MSDGMSEAFGNTRRLEREKESKKYIVFYVEKCEPKIKKFDTLEKAKRFATRINSLDNKMDNWVDYIVRGKVIWSER